MLQKLPFSKATSDFIIFTDFGKSDNYFRVAIVGIKHITKLKEFNLVVKLLRAWGKNTKFGKIAKTCKIAPQTGGLVLTDCFDDIMLVLELVLFPTFSPCEKRDHPQGSA